MNTNAKEDEKIIKRIASAIRDKYSSLLVSHNAREIAQALFKERQVWVASNGRFGATDELLIGTNIEILDQIKENNRNIERFDMEHVSISRVSLRDLELEKY